ncbi:replication protein [Clostridium sp. C2-6-12]|uniref:replication protein n=1 Tax=Clostridium sp. C2-6-12 TaxID=2698832 RepID=UPI00243409E9|nr:replication protein [Clostridium sp. C2-6-12]
MTINNPLEKDFTHDKIKEEIKKIKSCIYYCLSDEIGSKEKTHHTHIFIACSSSVRFSTIKNRFSQAHIEMARGTSEQNRDYVFKNGKYEKEKGVTKLPDTQEEFGEMPLERQGARNDINDLYDMIKDGMSDYEIFEENPNYILQIDTLEKVRQTFRQNEYKSKVREIIVTYIWGKSGTGKTHGVMNKYGFENVYRVTNYSHGGFDGYRGQDVIIFEEFYSNFKIQDMLNYLDCYPLELPCRYTNKVACFTKIYIISNIDLFQQYLNIQVEYPETWIAFLRRINKVIEYHNYNSFNEYEINDYIENYRDSK